MTSLKIIFAGTPNFAVPTLQALIDSSHSVCAVYTQPDRPAGRGRKLTASPIKQLAESQKIPVCQPTTLRSKEAQRILFDFNADIMIVIAYGLLLPKTVLQIPRLGCINVHASILPRWRGAAPIQRAILAGDDETGITIMQMEEGLDTGPVLSKATCRIENEDTSQSLHDKLAQLGASELIKILDLMIKNEIKPIPQDHTKATYAKKITKSEALIDWQQSASEIERAVRAFNPWPICFTQVNNQTLRIWQAQVLQERSTAKPGTIIKVSQQGIDIATRKGVLRILQLQFPGSRVMSASDALNAKNELLEGTIL